MRVSFGFGVVVWLGVSAFGCSAREGSNDGASRVSAPLSPPIALGPEVGTDRSVPIQKDVGWNPAVGTDGAGFLAVETIANVIRGVRVDGAGHVLDPVWLSIGDEPDPAVPDIGQYYPNVAYGGGHYLVTWTQPNGMFDPEHPEAQITDSVRARFVSSDGTVAGSGSTVVSIGDALYSSAAWTGSQFVLAWLGLEAAGANIHTVLLDANGVAVPNSHRVVSTSGTAGDPRLTVSAGQTFVVWYDYGSSDMYGARITADGTVLDPGGQPLSNGTNREQSAAVASDGSGFLIVWQADNESSSIRGSLVSADGTVVARDFPISNSTGAAGLPSVTFDGSEYLVAWSDERNDRSVYGVHVSTSGVVGSDETRVALGSPRYANFGSDRTGLAFNGENALIVFLGKGVEGSLVSPSLEMQVGSIGLTALPNAQGFPRVMWNGSSYTVAWINELADWDQTSARAVRISGRGEILDPDGLLLSGDSKPFGMSIASDEQNSGIVLWANSDETQSQWLRTLSSSGALGEPHAFPVQNGSRSVALAGRRDGFFAVTDNSTTGKVEGWVVDALGNAAEKIEIADTQSNVGSAVFAAGDGYLVSYGGPGTNIVPVSREGSVGIPVRISEATGIVQVATNGDSSLIVWSSWTVPTVYGQFFQEGALVGAPFVLSEQSAGYGATAAWDGTTYLVAWDLEGYTIEGRSVGADGTLGEVIPLVSAEADGPVLASDGDGQLLLSYIRWYEHGQTRRVTSRLIGRDADAQPMGGAGGGASIAGSNAGGSPDVGGATAGGAGSSAGGSTANGSTSGIGGSTAGSAGSGGLGEIIDELGCGIAKGGRANDGFFLWAAAAMMAFALRRRERDASSDR